MAKIITILNSPPDSPARVTDLLNQIRGFLEQVGLNNDDLRIYTRLKFGLAELAKEKKVRTLVLAWSAGGKPNLDYWTWSILQSNTITEFIPLDLESEPIPTRKPLDLVPDNTGNWTNKAQRTKLMLFLNGFYLNAFAPFGLRLLKNYGPETQVPPYLSGQLLAPGPINEVDIVRLVFNLFVDHGYNYTEISNLLNAQGIKPPSTVQSWSHRALKVLLQSAIYIGVNKFRGCIKHNVVPPLIDRIQFFNAQSKILANRISRT